LVRLIILLMVAISSAVPAGAADLNAPYTAESQSQLLYDWTRFYAGAIFFGDTLNAEYASLPFGTFQTPASGVLSGTSMDNNSFFSPNWLLLRDE
jgi:hypothetical protein